MSAVVIESRRLIIRCQLELMAESVSCYGATAIDLGARVESELSNLVGLGGRWFAGRLELEIKGVTFYASRKGVQ